MSDIIGKRRFGYLASGVATILGLVFILLTLVPNAGLGLQFSIAYTGGTVWEVHFAEGAPTPGEVRAVLEEQGLPNSEVAITRDGDREFILIRTEALTLLDREADEPEAGGPVEAETQPARRLPTWIGLSGPGEPQAVSGVPTEGRFGELATALQERFGPIDEVRQQNSVGPVVSNELIQQTILLIVAAAAAIMLYITYRFRDFRMGASAIVALLHDIIVTVGLFAVLGTFLGIQVDALFVTAMLTVIGFSVHDTIVVFDRVRENRQRYLGEPLADIANHSLLQTIGRSITTSLTLLVTVVALLLLGGEAIRSFMLVLLIGVAAGMYSSIIVATPLLVDWHAWDERRKARLPARAGAA